MSDNESTTPVNGTYVNNTGYTGDSILKIRLDTQQILAQIEYFLKGQVAVIEEDKEHFMHEVVVQKSKPLANDEGVHAILAFCSATINSQTVQGNYDWDTWRIEVSWHREQLATDLFVNYDIWGVSPDNISLICNVVMNMIKPFSTRLVNNEERKSYSNFSEMRTVQTPQTKNMLARMFG